MYVSQTFVDGHEIDGDVVNTVDTGQVHPPDGGMFAQR